MIKLFHHDVLNNFGISDHEDWQGKNEHSKNPKNKDFTLKIILIKLMNELFAAEHVVELVKNWYPVFLSSEHIKQVAKDKCWLLKPRMVFFNNLNCSMTSFWCTQSSNHCLWNLLDSPLLEVVIILGKIFVESEQNCCDDQSYLKATQSHCSILVAQFDRSQLQTNFHSTQSCRNRRESSGNCRDGATREGHREPWLCVWEFSLHLLAH